MAVEAKRGQAYQFGAEHVRALARAAGVAVLALETFDHGGRISRFGIALPTDDAMRLVAAGVWGNERWAGKNRESKIIGNERN